MYIVQAWSRAVNASPPMDDSAVRRRDFLMRSATTIGAFGALRPGAIPIPGPEAEDQSEFGLPPPASPSRWYEGARLNRLAFPMGGIGAGMLGLERTADADNSSLPVAALEYRIQNRSKAPVEAVFSFNAKNFLPERDDDRRAVRPAPGGFTLWSTGPADQPWREAAFSVSVTARLACTRGTEVSAPPPIGSSCSSSGSETGFPNFICSFVFICPRSRTKSTSC